MKSRRAISSVVGMVFALIALTSTITYVSYSMGILNNYNQSVMVKNQQMTDVDKEKFQISSVTIPSNNKLNVTVSNTGSLPITFTKIWVQNTSTTDWSRSYVPTNNFVSTGGVLTNVGQNIPVQINSAKSYNVKLVTSRGNTQQFTLNSINSAPLNIQLLSIPATVPSGFKSELVMIVTNNGSNTLANIIPQTPTQLGNHTATCSLINNQASPPSYNTLSPGSTAIFKWDVSITGTNNGQSCTWNAQLQNGYNGNSASATITVTQVLLSSTTYALNSGVLTYNFTSFKWVQSSPSGWNTGWSIPVGTFTGFSLQITNNNSTGTLWLSQQAVLNFVAISNNGGNAPFYIVNSTSSADAVTFFSCAYGDYCISVPPGQSATLYFAATKAGGPSSNGQQKITNAVDYEGFLVIFGKFATTQSAAGTQYAQNIPFLGLIAH